MKPWLQRIMMTVIGTLAASGIIAWSDIVIRNNETSARIEADVKNMNQKLDNFINLRYQADIDRIDRSLASVDERIDRLRDGKLEP